MRRTTLEIDEERLRAARDVLGTTGLKDTVHRALDEVVRAHLRRRLGGDIVTSGVPAGSQCGRVPGSGLSPAHASSVLARRTASAPDGHHDFRAELDYLIRTGPGVSAELALLQEVADEVYRLEAFDAGAVAEARATVARYRDLRLGLADASLVVLSRRHATVDLFSLDHRHFRTVTGIGDRPFRLLPTEA